MLEFTSKNKLAHHGILGMKWGVRRFQNEDGSYTNAGKERYNPSFRSIEEQTLRERRAALQTYKVRAVQLALIMSARKISNKFMSDSGMSSNLQRQTMSFIASHAAVTKVFELADRGTIAALRDSIAGNSNWKKKDSLAKASTEKDIHEQVVSQVNPDFGNKIGTVMNCRRCTLTYELRRRGYDVTSRGSITSSDQTEGGIVKATTKNSKAIVGGTGEFLTYKYQQIASLVTRGKAATPLYDQYKALKKDRRLVKTSARDVIKSSFSKTQLINVTFEGGNKILQGLAKQPNGSRGEVVLSWLSGGKHSVAYEIINNKPVIFDCQTGKKYTSAMDFVASEWAVSNAAYTRLDNTELNEKYLKGWVKNANG